MCICSEKLGDIILECRAKITVLWDECFVSTHERQKSKVMDTPDDMFTDEILVNHENLLQNLKEKHAEIMPILKVLLLKYTYKILQLNLVSLSNECDIIHTFIFIIKSYS